MTLEEIYEMMKVRMKDIYDNDREMVNLTVAEFMQLYHIVCYMIQMKHIVDNL